jgi:endoglucanase
MYMLKWVGCASVLLGTLSAAAIALAADNEAPKTEDKSKWPLELKVAGNKILNSKSEPVRLKGVNCASMEWTSDGEGHIFKTVQVAIEDWKSNIVRLPLCQDRWFGKTDGRTDDGKAYKALVKQIVDYVASKGCYMMLDLHWNDTNEWGQNIGQHSLPDLNSLAFWKDIAPLYANHPAVLFDLYNEPHDAPWDTWLKGGKVLDRPNTRGQQAREYEAVGMQQLLDAVRETGARNVIVCGGLDWAYDFSGIMDGRDLKDLKGNGVIYSNHTYNNKGDSVETWVNKMNKMTEKYAVIVSEFGGTAGGARSGRGGGGGARGGVGGADPLLALMQEIENHNWSYCAWDLHTSAGPTLISNWNYTPTPNFGVYVKQMLENTFKYAPPDAAPQVTQEAAPPVTPKPTRQ